MPTTVHLIRFNVFPLSTVYTVLTPSASLYSWTMVPRIHSTFFPQLIFSHWKPSLCRSMNMSSRTLQSQLSKPQRRDYFGINDLAIRAIFTSTPITLTSTWKAFLNSNIWNPYTNGALHASGPSRPKACRSTYDSSGDSALSRPLNRLLFFRHGIQGRSSERRLRWTPWQNCVDLVTDDSTRMQHGDTRDSKASPINWLRHFLWREVRIPWCVFHHLSSVMVWNKASLTRQVWHCFSILHSSFVERDGMDWSFQENYRRLLSSRREESF